MENKKKEWTAPGAQFFGAKVTVVLVRPIYARNIGYVSRSMGNMGCDRLVLIEPGCALDAEARQAASRAQRGLRSSVIYDDWKHFFESEGDGIRIGLTARGRKIRKNHRIETTLEKMTRNRPGLWQDETPIYLIFGPEDHGLTMDDLRFCHHWCSLGAFGYYPSLNISHAVLLALYNVRRFLELRDLESSDQKVTQEVHSGNTPNKEKYEVFESLESWKEQWNQPAAEEDESAAADDKGGTMSSLEENEIHVEADTSNTPEPKPANPDAQLKPFFYPEETIRDWLECMGLNTREKKVNALSVLNRMILESDPTRKELQILETLLQQNMRMLRQSGAIRRQRGITPSDHDL